MMRLHVCGTLVLVALGLTILAPRPVRGEVGTEAVDEAIDLDDDDDDDDDEEEEEEDEEEADWEDAIERFGDYASAEGLGLVVGWNGYLRFAGEVIANPDEVPFVGRNDGFKLANARVGLRARRAFMTGYVSLEAAAGEGDGVNDPSRELRVRLRDAFLRFDLGPFALITAGRFKTPYDLGTLKSTVRRTFIDLPVESRGVGPAQGFEQAGLAQGRQLGLMIHRDRVGFSEEGFDLGYALAVTNGRTGERLFNDDDTPAAFARVTLHAGRWAQVSLAGFVDGRTVGDLPDLFVEETTGAEASFVVEWAGLTVEAQALIQSTAFVTSGRDDLVAYGGHAQIAYRLGAFEIAYRYALLEPNTDDLEDFDRVQEHTAGLNYRLEDLPLSLFVNGTLAVEQEGRTLDNDRLAALVQLTF